MRTNPAPTKSLPSKPVPKLKTEPPISEKDEVKKAEDRTRKSTAKKF